MNTQQKIQQLANAISVMIPLCEFHAKQPKYGNSIVPMGQEEAKLVVGCAYVTCFQSPIAAAELKLNIG